MAVDALSRRQGGRDWSCGISGDDESGNSREVPTGAILAAGALAVGATIAGVFVASSIGGRRPGPAAARPRPAMGPPTMIATPGPMGYSVNKQAQGYFNLGR